MVGDSCAGVGARSATWRRWNLHDACTANQHVVATCSEVLEALDSAARSDDAHGLRPALVAEVDAQAWVRAAA